MADNNFNNSAPPPVPIPNPGYTAPPNPGNYFSQGWALVQQNLGTSVLLALIPGIAGLVIYGIWAMVAMPTFMAAARSGDMGQLFAGGIVTLATIAAFVLSILVLPALQVGVLACFWQALPTGRLTTDALTSRMHLYPQIFIAGLIIGVINLVISAVANAIPGVGSILSFVISLPLMSWMYIALYDMAIRDDGAIPALTRSFEMLKADFFNMTIIGLIACLVMMVGVVLCGIGSLITTPIINAAYGYLYRDKTS